MRMQGRWIGTPLLFATLACSDAREPATVTLELDSPNLIGVDAAWPALETGSHLVRVRRTVRVPSDCGDLAGAVARAAGELTLRVAPRTNLARCVGNDTLLTYTATIEGLRPGRYSLRVVHARAGVPSDVVLVHPIMVVGKPDPPAID